MSSPTLKLILENWKGDPMEVNPQELPFDIENLCRELDPIVNCLIKTRGQWVHSVHKEECEAALKVLLKVGWLR